MPGGTEQLPLDIASEAQNKTAVISGPWLQVRMSAIALVF
jgi:hypothetical protein